MIDAMIDIETLGTLPGSTVLSIGMVVFERVSGEERQQFYVEISRESCRAVGLLEYPVTLSWWMGKPAEARQCLNGAVPIAQALTALSDFYHYCSPANLWAQGTDFDISILNVAYDKVGLVAPWKYYTVRDTRTAYDLYQFDDRAVPRQGTYHNALDDSRHQVKCLSMAMRGGE